LLQRHYLIAFVLLGVVTLISQVFGSHLERINIALMHLIPVIIIALRGNMGATLLITTLSVIMFDLLYVPPQYSFNVHDLIYVWSFLIFYAVGYTITFQAKRIHVNEIRQLLLHTLSHDLKTPLSSILGNASLLLQKQSVLQPSQMSELIIQIEESALRMDRLIATLLDSARLHSNTDALKQEWCDLEDLIGVMLQEFPEKTTQERLHIHTDDLLPLYWGDGSLLVRLLVNLLDNALKYSPQNRPIDLWLRADAEAITIQLCNESHPMEHDDLTNIFDRFYRLDNAADIHGSGIGLSICKEIAEAHHGSIEAYREAERICFKVLLPLLRRANETQKEF
jgi:two-component system, OmpR family, sensor histidine kinase KdpD